MKHLTTTITGIALLLLLVLPVQSETLQVPVSPTNSELAVPGPDEELTLDLQGAFAMALQRNLSLQVGRYSIAAADAAVVKSTGLFDPNLSLSVTGDDSESPTTTQLEGAEIDKSRSARFGLSLSQLLPTGTYISVDTGFRRSETNSPWTRLNPAWGGDFSINLTQPLLDGFGTLANRSGIIVAHNSRQQNLQGFEIDVISTLQDVEAAYWDLIASREAVKVKEQSMELANRLLNETEERVKVGTSAPIDLVQSEAGVARNKGDVISARNVAANAEDVLKAALGFDRADEWLASIVTTDTFEVEPIHPDLAQAIETGLERRPELLQQQLEIEYRELQVKLARNQVLPNLDFNATYGYSGVGGTNTIRDSDTGEILAVIPGGFGDAADQITGLDFPHWTLGVTLKMPIGNHDARASVAQARYQLEQSRLQLRQLQQQIIREIRSAVRGLEDGAAAVEAAVASSEFARRNLEAEQTKFNNGLSTNYQVLEIQDDLDQALLSELQSRISYRRAILAYRVATGTYLEEHAVKIEDATVPDEPHQLWKDVKWLQFVDLKQAAGRDSE